MALFLHLLGRANHKETKWRTETIRAGQLLTGRKQLADWSGLSERQVRTVLKDLKNSGEIDQQTTRHYSIITITKWSDYQLDDQQTTSWRPANDQLTTTSKNAKNVKNEKNTKSTHSFFPDLVECFPDAELKEWLSISGNNAKSQELLWGNYHEDDLKTEIQSAYLWQLENKKRGAGSFLVTWLKRSGKKTFQEQQDEMVKITKKAMGL